jgi:hypothetical protein
MTEFDTEIYDEDDYQFWGFATAEDMYVACGQVPLSRSEDGWFLIEGPSSLDDAQKP